MTQNEIRYGMPFSEYQARPGINATTLKAARRSMLHARHAMTCGREPSASMAWGSLAHMAVLEQARFLESLVVWDGGDKRGKEWAAFRAAPDGATIVKRGELEDLGAMIEAVRGNKHAALLIAETKHEVSMFWEGRGYGLGKSRLDGHCAGIILEVKTARDISDRAFCGQFERLGYALQVGWQVEAAEANGDNAPSVYVVAIENAAPWDVRVWRVDPCYVAEGRKEARKLAVQLAECRQRGVWPGQSTEIEDLVRPAWAGGDEVDISTGTTEACAL